MVIKMKNKVIKLFLTFFRIGLFTFGGGYAMIPLMQRETVEKNGWISDDDILEIIALAESTPGPIAINSATFIGYKTAGVIGSVAATLGTVLPSFIIILIISFFLRQFQDIQAVKFAFNGIRAGVLALLIKAWWNMFKKMPKHSVAYVIAAGAFIVSAFTDVNILIVIAGCGIVGLVTSIIAGRRIKQ